MPLTDGMSFYNFVTTHTICLQQLNSIFLNQTRSNSFLLIKQGRIVSVTKTSGTCLLWENDGITTSASIKNFHLFLVRCHPLFQNHTHGKESRNSDCIHPASNGRICQLECDFSFLGQHPPHLRLTSPPTKLTAINCKN